MVCDEGKLRIAGGCADLGMEMLSQAFRAFSLFLDPRPCLARRAAQVGAPVAGIAITVERGGIDIEWTVVIRAAFGNQLIGGGAFQAGPAQFRRVQFHLFRRAAGTGQVEQRIGFQRLADETFDFEIG